MNGCVDHSLLATTCGGGEEICPLPVSVAMLPVVEKNGKYLKIF